MEQNPQVAKIMKRFKSAKAKRSMKIDPMFQELDAFDRNEQWDLQVVPPWLPRPVTNFIHLIKYTKRAAMAVENPTGKLYPVSPDDVDSVDQLQKIYEWTWKKVKARKVIRQNIETAKLLGTGIAYMYWEEKKEGRRGSTVLGSGSNLYEGEICLKEIQPSSFYPDPNAFTLEDCQFVHIVERKSKEWVKKTFGEAITEDSNSPEDRGEILNRDYSSEQNGLITLHSHFEKKENEEGGWDYSVTYVAGGKILKEVKKLKPNRYPFAILQDFPQRQDFWALSTCYFVLDNQKIINKVESIIAMIGTLMQNPQKVIDKTSGINPKEASKYGMAPGHTFIANGDPARAMIWKEPPTIPQALFNLLETAKQNIREITGLSEAYMGQNVGSLQTSSGVDSLIERATLRDRDQMFDAEMYIEDLSNMLIDFIVEYYNEERVMRISGDKQGEFQFLSYKGSDYKELDFDMEVNVSAQAPISRMREEKEAMELLNMQGQYSYSPAIITPEEFVKQKGYTHADETLARMSMEKLQNKTDQAMQVAQMMSEALSNGVDQEQVMQMAQSMFQQIEENPQAAQGGGAPGQENMNEVQMRQQTPMEPMGMPQN